MSDHRGNPYGGVGGRGKGGLFDDDSVRWVSVDPVAKGSGGPTETQGEETLSSRKLGWGQSCVVSMTVGIN